MYKTRLAQTTETKTLRVPCRTNWETFTAFRKFMEDVLHNPPLKRSESFWKRIIKDNARFQIVNKAFTHEAKKKSSTKGAKNLADQNNQLDGQNGEEHSCLKVCCRDSTKPPQKLVSVNGEDDADHISTQSFENSRRNAICEAIEKQYIDHMCTDHEVNLHQRRDCLRVEHVLREVCLL